MDLHRELAFEDEICAHLAAHGWLYEPDSVAFYERPHALFAPDLIAWIEATQPEAWEILAEAHDGKAEVALFDRLRKQLDDRGTLDVLRHGVEMVGLRHPISLAQFKPALAMNADIVARYAANRLRVVRQVHYSTANENSIDLVLFLNGLPVATAELKTDFTQSVEDAVDQYRFDRNPRPKGQHAEPLLSFPERGARPFRGQQQRSPHDDAPRGAGDDASCRSTRAITAARATSRTHTGTRPAISGKKSGRATRGSKFSAAISSPRRTRRSRSRS